MILAASRSRRAWPALIALTLVLIGCPHPVRGQVGDTLAAPAAPAGARFVEASDLDEDGDLDGEDLRLAFARCGERPTPGGCVVSLLPATYHDIQLVVPPTVSELRGTGDASTLVGRIRGKVGPILRRRPSERGHATRFVSFRIDGAKQQLAISPGTQHNCIRIGDKTRHRLTGGLIENVTCESVAKIGFFLEDAPGWTIRGNRVRYIGCWDATGTSQVPWRPNGIPAERMGCGAWGRRQPDEFNQPGRITPGIGIEVTRNSHDVDIDSNLVQYFTKIGIQGISSDGAGTGAHPRNGRIANNTVEWGLTGIALVRTRGWTVSDNVARDLSPAWMYGNVGKGFGCAHDGVGSRWLRNQAIRTGGVGFDIGCSCRPFLQDPGEKTCQLEATANRTTDSCLRIGKALGAIDVQTKPSAPDERRATGVVLSGNEVVRTRCDSAVNLRGFDDVRIGSEVSRLEAGERFGLRARSANDLVVHAPAFRGSGKGVALQIDAADAPARIEGRPTGTWGPGRKGR